MDAELIKHLWKSSDVRAALKKEAWRLLVLVAIYVGVAATSRYFRGKPVLEGTLSATIGAAAIMLLWFISAVRTLRAVLRAHGLLQR